MIFFPFQDSRQNGRQNAIYIGLHGYNSFPVIMVSTPMFFFWGGGKEPSVTKTNLTKCSDKLQIERWWPKCPGGTRLWLGRGGVPPGHRDPNPCLEVKKVPMFRDFAQKMDPCLGIF